jgi:hypothetical protein
MRFYTVHLPVAAGSGAPIFERAEFVRDGFNGFAFLFSAAWCLWKGLWLAALMVIILGAALLGIGRALHLPGDAQFWLIFVLALLVGLEASSFIRFRLRRHGYVDAGSVAAAHIGDAEAIFFARMADEMGASGRPGPAEASGGVMGRRPHAEDVVGLFPEYRGR